MNIDVELIEKVVKKVLNDVETGSSESEYGYGIFDTMDEAIEASAKAQKEYMNHSMADRQRYVEGIREVVCTKENLEYMSKLAVEVEHGNRHTAMMHSKNVDKLTKMAKEIETTIFVKNGPSYAGIGVGGMGYTTFTIAGPTGEGLTSAKSFCRKRRCVLQDGLHIRMK